MATAAGRTGDPGGRTLLLLKICAAGLCLLGISAIASPAAETSPAAEPGGRLESGAGGFAGVIETNTPVSTNTLATPTNVVSSSSNAPPRGAGEAPAGFRLPPGLRLDVVAQAPLVASPVAMAFDDRGRLFVAEMRDYPDRRDVRPHLGRIRQLEDLDGEGTFQGSTVFADDLPWPSALACYDGGLFVATSPDLLYLKDTSGQGNAGERKVVFAGLGDTNSPQALVHSLTWGLDNRFHAGRGVAHATAGPGDVTVQVADDFWFDPRSLTLGSDPGLSQSGLAFDTYGREFQTDWTRPLRLAVYDHRYYERNPFFVAAPESSDAAAPAVALFPLAAGKEPARAVAGSNSASSVWMTMARGTLIYRGMLLPSNYWGNVFIADSEARVIHREVLRDNGVEVVATRAPEERASEFLSSTDPAFHPTQVVEGPDGALYVADMREGGGAGRIYRIAPANFKPPKPPTLGQSKTYDLVTALARPGAWIQSTAARLLFERRDPTAAPLLTNMFQRAKSPGTRLQSLALLAGLNALEEPHLTAALRDPDEHLREYAVRLVETLVRRGEVSPALWRQLCRLVTDPSARVRLQLAFTIGEIRHPERAAVLAALLKDDPANDWLRTAAFSSLAGGGANLLALLSTDPVFINQPAGTATVRALGQMLGVQGRRDEVAQALDFVDRGNLSASTSFLLLSSLGEGLQRTRSSLGLLDPENRLQRFYSAALLAATTGGATEPTRLEALRLLGVSPYAYDQISDRLLLLLSGGSSPVVQSAVINTLGRYNDPRVFTNLVARWTALAPGLRHEAMAALLSRAERGPLVLMALEARILREADLSGAQINLLRSSSDPAISQRATRLFGPWKPERPAIVEALRPALRTPGVASRGRQIFLARCVLCHRLGGEGLRLGPDLGGAKVRGRESLLAAIFQPSVEIVQGYETQVLTSPAGETWAGIVSDQTPTTVTLSQPRGVRTVWSRANIQSIQPQPWSLMPDGLEQGLGRQEIADLLEYVMTTPR